MTCWLLVDGNFSIPGNLSAGWDWHSYGAFDMLVCRYPPENIFNASWFSYTHKWTLQEEYTHLCIIRILIWFVGTEAINYAIHLPATLIGNTLCGSDKIGLKGCWPSYRHHHCEHRIAYSLWYRSEYAQNTFLYIWRNDRLVYKTLPVYWHALMTSTLAKYN